MKMLKKESRLNDILLNSRHPYLWIVLTIVLVYFRTLSFGFTSLDDKKLILDNYKFILNLANVPQAFMLNAKSIMGLEPPADFMKSLGVD